MTDLVLTPTGLRYGKMRFPCVIGRGGIRVDKREGDGATPAGRHRIIGVMYRPDRMPRPVARAEPIGPRDLWSDAPDEADYNQLVRAPYEPSHESLRRADPLYDLILITDWNQPAAPGRGSAIFLHRWRRRGVPTEGCVALAPEDLLWLVRRMDRGDTLVVPESLEIWSLLEGQRTR